MDLLRLLKQYLLLLIVLICFAASVFGQTSTELVESAKKDLSAGRTEAAIAELTSAIRLDAKNAEAFQLRGASYASQFQRLSSGDRTLDDPLAVSAIDDLKAAVGLDPNDAVSYFYLGGIHSLGGADAKAIEYLQAAVKIKPGFAEATKLLANLQRKAGLDLAIKASDKAAVAKMEGRPAEQEALYKDALSLYGQAIGIDPRNSDLYSGRAHVYEDLGQLDAAIRDLLEAGNYADTVDLLLLYRLGKLQARVKQYDDAIKTFDTAIGVVLSADKPEEMRRLEFVAEIGRALALKGDNAGAIAKFDEVLAKDTRNYMVYVDRGKAFAATGDKSKAEADFRKALEIVPGRTDALQGLRDLGVKP